MDENEESELSLRATGGQVTLAVAGITGIQVGHGGNVPSTLGTVGTWTWTSIITYDPVQQTVALAGSTTITLAAALSGDMNIGRDAAITCTTIRLMLAAWVYGGHEVRQIGLWS